MPVTSTPRPAARMQDVETMRCLTVQPGVAASLTLERFRVPGPERGALLVRAIALGVCGTDRDIIDARYGAPPPGHSRLVLGHESLGRVAEAPAGSGFSEGDLVVGIVRHPDPVPCLNCAAGEWDMCRNGQFTEHGIRALDGFGSEWWRIEPEFAVRVDPGLGLYGVLVEPTSVAAKAWEQVERIGARALWKPARVLVTGAGPVGLLAALLSVQRGLEVHVIDRVADGVKPELVHALGATYHVGELASLAADYDVVLECTGASSLALEVASHTAPNGIVCLLGVTGAGEKTAVDIGAFNFNLVSGNRVLFGSVNANRRHYEAAMRALAAADRRWLAQVITRRVALDEWQSGFTRQPDDVKTVIVFDPAAMHD